MSGKNVPHIATSLGPNMSMLVEVVLLVVVRMVHLHRRRCTCVVGDVRQPGIHASGGVICGDDGRARLR